MDSLLNFDPAKSSYFLNILEISAKFLPSKIWWICWYCTFFTHKSFGSQNRQKFRKYAKNNWILRGSNFNKESIPTLYMNFRYNSSLNMQHRFKGTFWPPMKNHWILAMYRITGRNFSRQQIQNLKRKITQISNAPKFSFLRPMLASDEFLDLRQARVRKLYTST